MKLKYYGTSAGGGIPEIFCSCRICEHARKYKGKNIRTRSQAMLDDVLAIEYPVDTFAHTAYLGLDLRKVRHILITHGHHDHYLPEDIFSRPQGENWPVHFYCSEFTAAKLQKTIDGTEADFASGRRTRTCDYKVAAHALIPYQTTEILDYKVTPLRARHAEAIGAMIFIIQKGDKSILWAQDTGKFHPDAICFLGRDLLAGVKRLHIVSETDTVRLAPRCLGGHELSVGKFGRAVLPRDSVDLLFNLRLVRLQAIVDDRSHHRGQAVLAVLVLDLHDDCHSPSLPFDRARR
jgi:ribonuclease BN (tRNA processing enzyme)